MGSQEDNTAEAKCYPFHYVHGASFPSILQSLNASLFLTTYQAGKLISVRVRDGRVCTLLRTFDQAMGIAAEEKRLAIATRCQIWFLRNAPDIAAQIEPRGAHDGCFVPRASHVTGDVRCHEIGWGGDQLWIVNTRFSCLCTLQSDYSFVPQWQPPFVSGFAAEDRCHLNGLAIEDDKPRFVTALGETDTTDGWRENKATGGCLVDVESGQTVLRGLCMPHSPRLFQNQLFLLDSGTRRLLCVDLRTGRTAAFLEFDAGVEEVFDVQVLRGVRYPAVIGLQKETIHGTFIVPPAK